jgi:uncharacterized protein (UPF0332 family)/predicted nucleotidyltransferase
VLEASTVTLTDAQQRALDNLPPRVVEALSHFLNALLARFPNQIRRVILYGSFARGKAHEESDVDVMVIVGWEFERLPGGWYRSPYSDPRWQAIIDLSVKATLECDRDVAPLVLSEEMFYDKLMDVAQEARREGIELYTHLSGMTVAGKTIAAPAVHVDADTQLVARVLKEEDVTEGYDIESAETDDPRLWLTLADEKLQVARELLDGAYHNDAVSRAYYGMFYAVKALLLSVGVVVKSHSGANSEFGRHFVKMGRVGEQYQAMFSRTSRDRERSDYAPKTRPKRDDVERIIRDAEFFVAKARELVEEELSQKGSPS